MAEKNQHDPFKTFKKFFGNQKWIASVEKQFEQQYKNVMGSFDKNFKKAISNFNLITSKELDKLEKRISELEKQVGKPMAKKKAASTKKTSKKPVKKTVAKKAAPKAPAKKKSGKS